MSAARVSARRVVCSLFLASLAIVVSGCADTLEGADVAEKAVQQFHSRLEGQAWKLIHDDAGEELRSAISEERLTRLFQARERKLGPLLETERLNWQMKASTAGTVVTLVYRSRHQDGNATEQFVFRVTDGKAKLIAYVLTSYEMLVR